MTRVGPTYDKTSQLTGADHSVSGPPDESYSFDANGNRTGGSYDTDPNNVTVSDGTYTYDYDDEGNRIKKTTISTGAYEVYTWDHRNRLTSVTFKNSSHTVLKTVEQEYDILNRWTHRRTDPDGPGGASAVDTFFAYDAIQPIYQFDGTADTDLIDRYLWGPMVDQVLADEQVISLGSAGNIIWPFTDYQGTARDLGDQNESTHATIITNHRTIDGFGLMVAQSNSAIRCDIAYSGKLTDADTKLENHVTRWYDASIGQWANEDTIGFSGRDANLRRASANSLLNLGDPLGTAWWEYGPFRRTDDGLGFSVIIRGNYGGTIAKIELPAMDPYAMNKDRLAEALAQAFVNKYKGYGAGPNLGTVKVDGWPNSSSDEDLAAWIDGILVSADSISKIQNFFDKNKNVQYGPVPIEGTFIGGPDTSTPGMPKEEFPGGIPISAPTPWLLQKTAAGILVQPNTGEIGKDVELKNDGFDPPNDLANPFNKTKGYYNQDILGKLNNKSNNLQGAGGAAANLIQMASDAQKIHLNQFSKAKLHVFKYKEFYFFRMSTEDGKPLEEDSWFKPGDPSVSYVGGMDVLQSWSGVSLKK